VGLRFDHDPRRLIQARRNISPQLSQVELRSSLVLCIPVSIDLKGIKHEMAGLVII